MSYIRGGGAHYTEKKISEAIENSLKKTKNRLYRFISITLARKKDQFFWKIGIYTQRRFK